MQLQVEPSENVISCQGDWDIHHTAGSEAALAQVYFPEATPVTLVGCQLKRLDIVGAWLLVSLISRLESQKCTVKLQGFSQSHRTLFELVASHAQLASKETEPPAASGFQLSAIVESIGEKAVKQSIKMAAFLSFVGETVWQSARLFSDRRALRWKAMLATIQATGYLALPIVGLLSFLIGIVLTYQLGVQLRNYGATIFVVNFLGLAVLREFAPLMTAIIIAGRTGSAFTAEIGTMQVNQELDALQTLGISPYELLIVPKLIGLLVTLPLLTVWSTFFSLLGGMIMANNMLAIEYLSFIDQFQRTIGVKHYWVGMSKTPVFAGLIALIGCYQGLRVQRSADSVGKQTTASVVQAIFFIIVVDALFSIFFNKLGL